MEEIKFLLRDARFYLVDLKSKLGYLSLGKISTDVISPITLKTLLLEIQDNTPDLISVVYKGGDWDNSFKAKLLFH